MVNFNEKNINKKACRENIKKDNILLNTQSEILDIDILNRLYGLIENFGLDENLKKVEENSHLLGKKAIKENKFGDVILGRLKKNISKLYEFIVEKEKYKGKIFYEFLLLEITKIDDKAKIAVMHIFDNVLKYFLSKNMSRRFKKLMKFKKLDFLKNSFYDFDRLSDEEIVLRSFYIIAVTYQLSYIFWMKKIYEQYKKIIIKNKSFVIKQELVKKYIKKLGLSEKSLDYYVISAQAYLFVRAFSIEEIKFLLTHVKSGRFKTLDSAVFKLMKKIKYLESYDKEDILSDQYGFLLVFDNFIDLKNTARILRKKYELFLDKKNLQFDIVYVNKYNDRGVLGYTASNTETGKNLLPFVNGGFVVNNIPLGEISCRFDYKVRLQEILQEYKISEDKTVLVKRLISEIDKFDHGIYKTSQVIKVLRKLFVDKNILPRKRILRNSAEKFIDTKLNDLIDDIRKKFKENGINIEFTDEELKIPILDRLSKQTRQAIIDLAWEKTKPFIKGIDSYKKLSLEEKKEFLKVFSKKLVKALDRKQKQIKGYGKEGNEILKIFRKNYKEALETSIFYPSLVSRIEYLKELEKAKFTG